MNQLRKEGKRERERGGRGEREGGERGEREREGGRERACVCVKRRGKRNQTEVLVIL